MKTVLDQLWTIFSQGYIILLANQLLVSRLHVTGYNFDDENITVYTDPGKSENARSSYFGYTVAIIACDKPDEDYYGEGEEMEMCSWLYVGAPRSNATNIFEPGNLYKCKIGAACSSPVNFETQYHRDHGFIRISQDWVGGSLAVRELSNEQGIVVCGWRWLGKSRFGLRDGQDGICYTMKFHKINGTTSAQVIDFGYDELGPPVECPPNTTSLVPGEPCRKRVEYVGMSLDIPPTTSDPPFVTGNLVNETKQGATMMCKKNVCIERYTSARMYDDFSYFGYAVSSGNYFKTGQLRYAVGGPRSKDFTGQVIIHDFQPETKTAELESILTINGTEFGEYFGASLASCNIQGDERHELVVGAPMSNADSKNTEILNQGRVYIYGIRKKKFQLLLTLDGNVTNGRFGSVITCLGDVDMDGYDEIAIGEPYANGGNVYIYNGHSDGLRRITSQIISAPPGLRGFGISIAKAQDFDHDGFADFAVGAYLSGNAVVIRSKAIIELQVSLPDPLTEANGSNPRRRYFASQICSSCSVAHIDSPICKELSINHKVRFDGIAGSVVYGNASTNESNGKCMICNNFTAIVDKKLSRPGWSPKIVGTARLPESNHEPNILTIGPDFKHQTKFEAVSAVVNPYTSNTTVTQLLPSLCSCRNQICRQNLSAEMTSDVGNEFIVGTKKIQIFVTVTNHADDAYESRVTIVLPEDILLVENDASKCKKSEVVSHPQRCNFNTVLPEKSKETIYFEVDTSRVTSNNHRLILKTYTSSANEIERSKEFEASLLLRCKVDYNYTVTAESSQISYPFVKTASTDIAFDHKYFIRSIGQTPIQKAKLVVSVPTHWDEIEVVEITNYPPDCKVLPKKLALYSESVNSSWVFLRCAEALVGCTQVECELTEVARDNTISLSFQINPYKLLTDDKRKDDLFFETNGTLHVNDEYTAQLGSSMSSEAVTKFVAREQSNRPDELASWIIPTSIFLGLLLLALLSFGLYKFGFFARKKRKELEMLQKNEDEHLGIAMQMTSSTEVLDVN